MKRKKMAGVVQKVIKPKTESSPGTVQIQIEGCEELYKEIRTENQVKDEQGNTAQLKPGAEVDVIIEADSDATMQKPA